MEENAAGDLSLSLPLAQFKFKFKLNEEMFQNEEKWRDRNVTQYI